MIRPGIGLQRACLRILLNIVKVELQQLGQILRIPVPCFIVVLCLHLAPFPDPQKSSQPVLSVKETGKTVPARLIPILSQALLISDLLFNLGSLTDTVAQIIQLSAADSTTANDLDVVKDR